MCGRCKEYCPVGIDTIAQRSLQRKRFNKNGNSIEYLKQPDIEKAHVAYFAGCMSHLTPSIIKSVTEILKAAGKNFTFIDSEGGACCGRPQKLAGNYQLADKLIEFNKAAIKKSGAKILLLSCPICYKVFKDDYNLDIEVLHHTEYFQRLIKTNQINVNKLQKTVVYHDLVNSAEEKEFINTEKDFEYYCYFEEYKI